MERTEITNEILNDLVKINNDRIAGYQHAINESKGLDIDLKSIFEKMIEQSTEYKEELSQRIQENGGEVEDDTTTSGKIYRAWMDIKAAATDSDRLSILGSCEFGEDAAQRAYDAALNTTDVVLDEETRSLIAEEQTALKRSHDLIKLQRDAHKAMQHK